MYHNLTCSCGEKWANPDKKRQFATVKEMSFCFLVSSWAAEPGGGCSPPSFCQIFAKSPFFASNFSISMPAAPSSSSQPPHFQIHSAVYVKFAVLK